MLAFALISEQNIIFLKKKNQNAFFLRKVNFFEIEVCRGKHEDFCNFFLEVLRL
jgi:hypothetical protein